MVKRIPLTRGVFALADDADYEWLNQWKWRLTGRYVVREQRISEVAGLTRETRKKVQMHRAIMEACAGQQVDHINGNPLDNRRENLRVASRSQNQHNKGSIVLRKGKPTSSIYKGVAWNKRKRGWWVAIAVNRKSIFIGVFKDEIEAAKAYDEAAKKHHGSFARLNFPDDA